MTGKGSRPAALRPKAHGIEAWAGKTSLLAEAVMVLPGNIDVVCYFLSRREADADSSGFLAAVVPQLASLLDEDPPAADLHGFRALWQRAAERAALWAMTCCWSWTAWMRISARLGCLVSRRCCPWI